ncbi:malate dehydrogenase (oxaloacetate-decarboxylating) [Propionibacterium cyclohexanicum]|uniref:Putative malate oxidoreductase [NAD] n=1 Tax=Propionibacterium cyclohexanicum TaxID=64702 RepID=A0A1H9SSR8_9ACTN|nr:NAD-dependent malic enzyme [Propionibacterium cyclohexanicum]SER87917.1 malate dehydrogenase (oxaloacetate-decarboxylating) [Propionibacterium cyclohexanicum]
MVRDYEYVQRDGKEIMRIAARGRDVLTHPMINFGTAYTHEQRRALGISGLLPSGVMSVYEQIKRLYRQYLAEPSDLARFVFLSGLQDRNEILFYRLLSEHIEEMLPIIYTPTIGRAIQEYSHLYQRPRGVFIDIDHPEMMEQSLLDYGRSPDDVDLIVVTDSEGILGIGDQGVGGVAITVGKLSVYTAAAGIHPGRALPVVLDTGTDNLQLLNDEGYLGVRHSRVRGERYDEFIDNFTTTAHRIFPHAMVHWEDFGPANAHRILARYRDELCTFNDDIQGTAAVVAAAALSAVRRSGVPLRDQRIVIYGAGTAGVGISDLLVQLLTDEGLTPQQARAHFWALGSRGLIVEGSRMRDFQQPYARSQADVADWEAANGGFGLAEVVRRVHPTMLIGCSAQSGAFTEPIITQMASYQDRPIIMPLSNPTSKAEALPGDVLDWTDGKALIATGSPFAPLDHHGVRYLVAQANNALVFPGIGLGVITSRATRVSERMILAAAKAVAAASPSDAPGASLLPSVSELRSVSAQVGLAVARQAVAEGLAEVIPEDDVQAISDQMWRPEYPEVEAVESL